MLVLFSFLLIAQIAKNARSQNVARTPPMGFNSWNKYGCSVNATILMNMATAIANSPLKTAGYTYVNSDDCWMLANRSASGNQVANPEKFPNGFEAVTAYIHSLGLKSGLYTAKGTHTCAGYAASCDHEAQDALQWSSWGIDYVKDDSCSNCGNRTDNDLYASMWAAIQASGREMVLTVEGNPDDTLMSKGGLGNAKRVGHDITALWGSMLSLVDIGSGLWMYAHNSTNPIYGGYWNDLDMIEVGNAPDFNCSLDAMHLAYCQVHFTMWTIMKAPLILGNDLTTIDAPTLAILTNAEAIAVSQDALGIQARRLQVTLPTNHSIVPNSAPDAISVIALCDSTRPTQNWVWKNSTSPIRDELYLVPCADGDLYQQWSFVEAPGNVYLLKNKGANQCVDAAAQFDPGLVVPCVDSKKSQQWTLEANGHISTTSNNCLDVFMFTGPDVEIGSCKVPGNDDGNQVWTMSASGQLSPASVSGQCLSVTGGPPGGILKTTDSNGVEYCLQNPSGSEGTLYGAPCDDNVNTWLLNGPSPVNVENTRSGSLNYNNQVGASGPFPGTRYTSSFPWNGASKWNVNLDTLQTTGSTIQPVDTTGIINDNLVGTVTTGGTFCLDLTTSGMLEVWAGPLTNGRWAVSLFNRSPGPDTITIEWPLLNISANAQYSVRDIWEAADKGTFTGGYSTLVNPRSVAYLVLTPA